MSKSTKKLTLSALFTALSVVLLYLASVMPTGQLGFAALASLCGVGAVIETGPRGGLAVYAASSLLGFLILPEKTYLLFYVFFFGCYPVIKLMLEKIRSTPLSWLLKLAVFNAALCVLVFLCSIPVFDIGILKGRTWLVFIVLNIVFAVYDLGVTQVIAFYVRRISPHIGKKTGR